MSAYVVDDQTINDIVAYVSLSSISWRTDHMIQDFVYLGYEFPQDREKLANDLFNMNCEAVDQRYGKDEWREFHPDKFVYRTQVPPTAPIAYKLIGRLKYQCTEGNVPRTDLYKALEHLHNQVAHHIARNVIENVIEN